jgi:ubiquinone/menaquinone biosynthesis C-methylase UbiE
VVSKEVVYNRIGKTYDQTRKADPEIAKKLIDSLHPTREGYYLDVGCGSGNYTCALSDQGFRFCGIDISEEMLSKARQKSSKIEWVHGDARNLPFQNGQFDGALSVLATHHIKDIEKCFSEVYRVIKKGNFVLFTSFPDQMKTWWLNHYFPNMMNMAIDMMHSQTEMFAALKKAGFRDIKTEKFFVSNDLKDSFLQVGKYRPDLYLDPVVRSGISTFNLGENQEEIQTGCAKLKTDIDSGAVQQIIESHENDLGDYMFVTASRF